MEKIGRNDPCSCGSGKKFKKCCEAQRPLSRFHLQNEGMHAKKIRNIAMPLFKKSEESPVLKDEFIEKK